jgi:phosphohistidine swiveling domain-containing protein
MDLCQVGAKAANLGKALRLGCKIPPGFVISQSALAFFLAEARLLDHVQAYLSRATSCTRVERVCAFEDLRSALLKATVPQPLAKEVATWTADLLDGSPAGLAVRSSARYEDSEKASFAGIFESYLCVSPHEELWKAIRNCWCAQWSPQAIDYAQKVNLALEPDGMAVIVQQTIPADSAGVIFTADPLTGNPWHFVLNATWGLAQGVVDGSKPSDSWALEWDTGELLERRIAEKKTALMPGCSGLLETPLPEGSWAVPSLTDDDTRRVAALALDLDRASDTRVDVEWALAGQDLYLVQVRPITALPPFFPRELTGDDAEITWRPSDLAWYTEIREGERLVAPFFRDAWALELWERHLLEGFFPRRVGQERDFNGYRYMTEWTWKTWGHDFESTILWLAEHEAELRQVWLDKKAEMLQACTQIAQAEQNVHQAQDLIPILLACRDLHLDRLATVWGPPQWMVFTCQYLLDEFLKDTAPDVPVGKLLQGLPCYSYERTRAALELGRSVREQQVRQTFVQLPLDRVIPHLLAHYSDCQFLKDLESLCWRLGMRPPTWVDQWWAGWGGEDSAQVLLAIRNGVLGQGRDVTRVLEECARDRQACEARLRARVRGHDPSLAQRFDQILGWAHFWVPVLDDRKWLNVVGMHLARLMDLTGTALTEEDLLDDPADILLMTVQDLGAIAKSDNVRQYREIYLARRREYERNRRLRPPDFLGRSPDSPGSEDPLGQGANVGERPEMGSKTVFEGHGLSPGRTTGIVHKTRDVDDLAFLDSLSEQDILVCPCFTSCGTDWLSLLVVARGLITVQGSQLGHAIQIARECGVPYVHLATDDWEIIPDGANVALDGLEGTVTVLDDGVG